MTAPHAPHIPPALPLIACALLLPLACDPGQSDTGSESTTSVGDTSTTSPPGTTSGPSVTTSGADSETGIDPATSSTGGSSTEGTDEDSTGSSDDGSTGSSGTGLPACEGGAIDLGDALPVLEIGDTVAEDNDHAPSCFPQCASDAAYVWTAPAAGTYTIDTQGSLYDTGLYVLDGCGEGKGPELACNDDAFGVQSGVFVDLAAGQTVTIIVDGYGLEEGPFQLNIVAGMAYDCLGWRGCPAGEYCYEGVCWPEGGGGSGTGGWGSDSGGWGSGGGTGGWSDTGGAPTSWGSDSGGWGGVTTVASSGGWGGSDSGGWGITSGGWGGSDSGGWGITSGGWGGSDSGGWGITSGGWGGSDSGGWGGSDSGGWGGSTDGGGTGGDDFCVPGWGSGG